MTSTSDLRVGDSERAAVADRLAAHAAAGRLGVEELEQRVERAHAALRRGELDALLADLPEPRRAAPAAAGALALRPLPLRRPPLALIGLALAATVALSLLAGHPLPPVFLVFLLLWRWFA
jgi:hypothetical protein